MSCDKLKIKSSIKNLEEFKEGKEIRENL